MFLIRIVLIASVLMAGFALLVCATLVEYGWLVLVLLFALALGRRATQRLSAYGTARWANGSDMKGMLDE